MTIVSSKCWHELRRHHQKIATYKIQDLYAHDPERCQKFSVSAAGLLLDYSRNLVDSETMRLLAELTTEVNLKKHIADMFSGKHINTTEQRAVLHTALRAPDRVPHLVVDDVDITQLVHDSLKNMQHCVERIRQGLWLGYSGEPICDVVNIGIGGSDLGPAMVTEALQPYADARLRCHFVSNIDAAHIIATLQNLNPATTLFIIASKTFTTQETLCNARTARDWLTQGNILTPELLARHFIAVTAKPAVAKEFGIVAENIYPFWDWVGGRYSLWSAIGLSIAISIGMENFLALLRGAEAMDQHFQEAPPEKNMPIILALLGIWHIDFYGAATQAVIPYDQYLALLPAYLQQLEMESNGKSVCLDGAAIDCATAPVIWGAVGTNSQHSFHQLFMQGTQLVPIDFILPLQSHNPVGEHHLFLVANCLAQAQALCFGKNKDEVMAELLAQGMSPTAAEQLAPHKIIVGNKPSNLLLMQKVTPETLGALIALYEHKVFVQGVIWEINSFDQWGVELGKKLSGTVAAALRGDAKARAGLDVATQRIVDMFKG